MNKAVDLLLGGWQTNGILTFAQGQFQTLNLGSDWILVGSFSRSIPQLVGDPFAGRTQPDRYWNASAFDFPRDAQGNRIRVVGNAGRNTYQQPGLNNWDLSMFKNFRMTEELHHPVPLGDVQYLEPHAVRQRQLNTQSATFGAITSTRVTARRMQLGLKVIW